MTQRESDEKILENKIIEENKADAQRCCESCLQSALSNEVQTALIRGLRKGIAHARAQDAEWVKKLDINAMAESYYQNFLNTQQLFYNNRTRFMKADFLSGALAVIEKLRMEREGK